MGGRKEAMIEKREEQLRARCDHASESLTENATT